MSLNQEISARTERVLDDLLSVRRAIHANPELAFEEVETAALVARTLRAHDIPTREGVAKTGVVGLIEGTQKGPERTIAVRADLDCLPIGEETDVPFASRNPGKSHCCGHDIHTAVLLGTGIVLQGLRDRFAGRVKLIFQPAEETLAGALAMIAEGVLEEPHVDAILGYHVWPPLPAGMVGYQPGAAMASSDAFDVTIKGVSGHAAHPHLAVDAVVAAAHFVTQVQTIVSREIAPLTPAVVSIGQIAGGTARNILPETVTLKGTIRTLDRAAREACEKALRRQLEGLKASLRIDYELNVRHMAPVLENNLPLLERVLGSARDILGPDKVRQLSGPSMGSEDFACFAEQRPAAHIRLGSQTVGRLAMLHNARFTANEEAIPTGVRAVSRAVLDLLA